MAARRVLAITVGLMLVLAGCGASGDGGLDDTRAPDARADVANDLPADDVAVDKDVPPVDATPEVAAEVAVEVAPDVPADEGPAPDDALPDTPLDTPADAPPEATVDVTGDLMGDLPCPAAGAAYDPEHPGVNVLFSISAFGMMGTSADLAIGMFLPTAREDFGVTKPYEQPLDTCVVAGGAGAVPGCTTDADCFPEQKCLAEQDNPANKQCITPRDPLDVGPFTASGFTSGPRTFTYNAGQSGAYTSTSDGQVPAGEIVFDQVYVADGVGDASKGLGAYRAVLYVPAQLELLSPTPTAGGMFGDEIQVDPAVDLPLAWSTGADGGTLDISLSSMSAGITCHAINDGSFTIPADMLQKANLGTSMMPNMLTLTRETPGEVCGEGVTVGLAKFVTAVMVTVKKVN